MLHHRYRAVNVEAKIAPRQSKKDPLGFRNPLLLDEPPGGFRRKENADEYDYDVGPLDPKTV
jgi:hypothetical protein